MAAVSKGILALYREYCGRGAMRTRTIVQDDYVVCFLEDIYTPLERTLIEAGRWAEVNQARNLSKQALRERFNAVVEAATERKVIAFFSQVHMEPDMALEGFVLESKNGSA